MFVQDIEAAARWYASVLSVSVEHENPNFAFVHGPGVVLCFHPADEKCPGGVGGTTVYWEVESLEATIAHLESRGAKLHRGPGMTDFGAKVAMLIDPHGCSIGLNQASASSRGLLAASRPSK